jgi:hypothetical protein
MEVPLHYIISSRESVNQPMLIRQLNTGKAVVATTGELHRNARELIHRQVTPLCA